MIDFKISLYANFRRNKFLYDEETYSEYVMFAVREGSFKYRLNSSPEQVLSGGEILVCPPGSTLYRKIIEPSKFFMVKFDIFSDISIPFGKIAVKDIQRLFSDLNFIKEDLMCTNVSENPPVHHYVRDALFSVFSSTFMAEKSPEFSDVISYISSHLHEEISNASLADLTGYSIVNFINKFKTEYGYSPHNYIINERLSKARMLLTQTNYTIKEISHICGYSDELYFSRIFKKFMKCSPKEFRKLSRL